MTEYSDDLVSQHPLYLAMCKCIEDELEMYDYHDFYPDWEVMKVNYRILIQELFGVERHELSSFLEDLRRDYRNFLTDFSRGYLPQVKRLCRLILSLPVCEYEIENDNSSSSSGSKGSSNNYTTQFPDFICDDGYLKELENDEVVHTVRKIFSQTENKQLDKTLLDFAFHEYESIPRKGLLEDPYRQAFLGYLIQPICSMLRVALHIETKVETERPALWYEPVPDGIHLQTRTDIVVSRGNLVYCVIETKKYPLLPKYNDNPSDGIISLFSKQKEITKQLICEMLYFKTDRGILTDSYTSVLVELDLDSFERNIHNSRLVKTDNEPKIIPIRYMIRDCHSAKPTLRESLLSYIYNSVEADSKMAIKQERVQRLEEHLKLSGKTLMKSVSSDDNDNQSEGSGSRPSTRDTNVDTLVSIPEGTRKEGDDFRTQLIKLESMYFEKSLLESIDDRFVVAKVYDPRNMNRDQYKIYTPGQERHIRYEWFKTEKVCYSILSKDTEFNSSYVRKGVGQTVITMERSYIAKGYFNLFRYIESIQLPKDRETYEKAKKQLEIIHRNGIIHRNIKEGNILYSKEGLVYIIDFCACKTQNQYLY
ncbi:DEHA2E07348p [Debaryomyces hansenii CBS767]|uniref:DEHA2E07348p n=1 Tax=Debaryomyces hansenii (strain ATCC 36239 / CBS 767 / BCRC 21394 / JCM 1990 / NBRC 0083 / IGC 2968) TaxID=284592 RepID=Q6BQ90_DEBHA|nr:DEHA2E07348p [Debaryomyces hansenii CBS767]CAG87860.2 DEHA2E07348p [Debaryomyces hansenii CBS767]|eukprot:XP_459630.2 DEHA2E07348p [Debaryomyces hansenii CBS767]